MLRRTLKASLFSRDAFQVEIGEDVAVDETGIDIIEALDVFTVKNEIGSPTRRRKISGNRQLENDLHSRWIGDLAFHSPRQGTFPAFDHRPKYSTFQSSSPEDTRLKPRNVLLRSDSTRKLEPRTKNDVIAENSVIAAQLRLCRREAVYWLRKKKLSEECELAVKRGKQRCQPNVFPAISKPEVAAQDSKEISDKLRSDTSGVQKSESSFSGFRSPTGNFLKFSAKLCDTNQRFSLVDVVIDQSSGSLELHEPADLTIYSITDVANIQVSDTRQLVRLELGSLVTQLFFPSLEAGSAFLLSLEFSRRRLEPGAENLLSSRRTPVNSKLEAEVWTCEWNSLEEGLTVEPIGEFWYKEGDHTDQRDWEQGYFYTRCGVLYGCPKDGELPSLVVNLKNLSSRTPDGGNRFLLQIGDKLTLSSPSHDLRSWTRSALQLSSEFQMEQDWRGTTVKSFYLTDKELLIYTEPGQTRFLRRSLSSLLRIIVNPAKYRIHLAWLGKHSLDDGNPSIGGSLAFPGRPEFDYVVSKLSAVKQLNSCLSIGTRVKLIEENLTADLTCSEPIDIQRR